MTTDVITSLTDLDDLDLDLETDGVSEITDATTLDSVASKTDSDDDLTLDDLEEDTVQPAASNSQETDELKLDDETSSIDDLKLEDNIVDTPVDTAKPELTKPILNLDEEIELDLDVNEGITKKTEVTINGKAPGEFVKDAMEAAATPPVEEKKKRGRKPKEVKPAVVTSAPVDTSKLIDPEFPLAILNVDKYATRSTIRSDEEVTELAEKIKLQGQVEPIHVYIADDGVAYLLAGLGRKMAIQDKLGRETAEAIVHKGLTEADIYKICTGTNEPRTKLTEWDKIVSIGKYADTHPGVSVDDETDTNSMVRVFGYSRSAVYQYLKAWNVLKNSSEFIEYFNRNGQKIAGYTYQILANTITALAEHKLSAAEWLVIFNEIYAISTRQSFATMLIDAANTYLVMKKPASVLATEVDDGLSKTDERFLNKSLKETKEPVEDIDNTMVDKLEQEIAVEQDSKEVIDGCYQSVLLTLTQARSGIESLIAIEKYQELKNPVEIKKIKEMVMMVAESAKKL
ncbi:ParB/Srx family N-terminal domain-containing protein [Methanoculleus sp.]|uniref:ParB/Srx family N-terminal domain-containing protein n=1 Tax=Methanoculleus sp. TaxID=90427 RepID=UPI0025D297F9|nr:ParB/Srx family N-terminal domain-containing protein [Methanoculleus sp.]MCK9319808.1 ParB/Srx family N-terminal domain-containing protein [Methanoculleus sp.]